jgi:hypothetical protein
MARVELGARRAQGAACTPSSGQTRLAALHFVTDGHCKQTPKESEMPGCNGLWLGYRHFLTNNDRIVDHSSASPQEGLKPKAAPTGFALPTSLPGAVFPPV